MADPFAAYKLPAGVVEGVEIPLPGTDAVFKVRLPSMMDEGLQLKIVSRVNLRVTGDEEEDSKIDAAALRSARQEVFFEECILEARGLPKDTTHQEFFNTYALAAREIFAEASARAMTVDEEVREALGNLKPTPNGKTSGRAKPSNTKNLSKVA